MRFTWYDTKHFTRKLVRVTKMMSKLWRAQMFGIYKHSGWGGSIDYARYEWRGKEWIIPINYIEDEL